jgi:hypothetical protein
MRFWTQPDIAQCTTGEGQSTTSENDRNAQKETVKQARTVGTNLIEGSVVVGEIIPTPDEHALNASDGFACHVAVAPTGLAVKGRRSV